MIKILLCADKSTLQCCEALFDKMDTLKDDNIEFLFENPRFYKKKKLKEYASLKNDSRFFKYPCRELSSGILSQYLSEELKKDISGHFAHLFLVCPSREMLQTVVENYSSEFNFTVRAFLEQEGEWDWKVIHSETDITNAYGEDSDKKYFSNKPFKEKILKSPSQRKKSRKTFWLTGIILVLLAVIFMVWYFIASNKEKEKIKKEASESAVETQPETVSEEEILLQAQDIYKKYFIEEISYEDALQDFESLPEIESEEIDELVSDINSIQQSRETYHAGEEALGSGNYQTAIDCFSNVIEKDTNYYKLAQSEIQVAVSEYKEDYKKDAEELMLSGNYGDAYMLLKEAVQNFSDDDLFVGECTEKQKQYMDEWINSQRQAGNYFGDNGAVILAYSYEYFDMDGGLDNLLQEAYQHEREQLISLLNEKRAELGYEPMVSNDALIIRAEGDAQLIKENRAEEVYSNYNYYCYNAQDAENAMEKNYIQLEGIGEFAENSKYIGIGILFDEEEMTCVWVVLTAAEIDI